MLDVEVADVEVGLPGAHEDDGLARGVHERERRAHLVADRVELGEHDAVDDAPRLGGRVLEERLVEAGDLVDRLVMVRVRARARARARVRARVRAMARARIRMRAEERGLGLVLWA